MKELNIVYQDADYVIRYECDKIINRTRRIEGRPALLNYIFYAVFFEDETMKEQFGNPFEFYTGTYPNFFTRPPIDSASALRMVEAIIKAMPKEDSL